MGGIVPVVIERLLEFAKTEQGCDRFFLCVDDVLTPAEASMSEWTDASVGVLVHYDLATRQSVVLIVSEGDGSPIFDVAWKILAHVHREHVAKREIRWRDTRWCYRSPFGEWSEIVVAWGDGGAGAVVSFRQLGEGGFDDVVARLGSRGFKLDPHERHRLRLEIRRCERQGLLGA